MRYIQHTPEYVQYCLRVFPALSFLSSPPEDENYEFDESIEQCDLTAFFLNNALARCFLISKCFSQTSNFGSQCRSEFERLWLTNKGNLNLVGSIKINLDLS